MFNQLSPPRPTKLLSHHHGRAVLVRYALVVFGVHVSDRANELAWLNTRSQKHTRITSQKKNKQIEGKTTTPTTKTQNAFQRKTRARTMLAARNRVK